MPFLEAAKLAKHPVACIDCHDPKSMQLRVTKGVQERCWSTPNLPDHALSNIHSSECRLTFFSAWSMECFTLRKAGRFRRNRRQLSGDFQTMLR